MVFSIGDAAGLFGLLRDIVRDGEDVQDVALTDLADRIEPNAGLSDWPEVVHPRLRKRLSRRAVGRARDMLRLAELVEGGATSVITALHGAGGIGKTTLALEFLRFGLKSHRLQGIWIVKAESRSTMIEEILELGAEIGMPVGAINETAAQKVLAAIADRGIPWLILYDNAPDRAGIDPFLIEGDHLRYVVTSRDRDWSDAGTLALDVLPADAAEKLLREESGRDEDYAALARALDRLPLALVIAGAYLRNAKAISPDSYLSMLEDRLDDTGAVDYPASVRAAVELSVDALPNDGARDLLSLAAYLSPDDVWVEMIEAGAQDTRDLGAHDWPGFVTRVMETPARLHDAVAALERASLLKREGEGDAQRLTVHRLTQAVMRARLCNHGERWADVAARMINAYVLGDFSEPARWSRYARLVPQAEALLPHAPPSQATDRAFDQIGGYLNARGDYPGAIRLLNRAVEISVTVNGKDTALHAVHLNNLASPLERNGDPNRARKLYRKAITIDEDVLGDHPQTATHVNNLASLYQKSEAFSKAEPLYLRTEHINKVVLGEDHPSYAIRLGNLGVLYDNWSVHPDGDTEKRKQAADYLERALATTRKALGEMRPETATDLNNLAIFHHRNQDWLEAIPAMQRAVAILLDLLGPKHPNTQTVLNSFAAMIAARDGGGAALEAEIQRIPEEIAAVQTAHVAWGIGKLEEIAGRHGVSATDPTALAEAVQAETARLREEGAPEQKWTWPETELRGTVFALQQAEEWGITDDDLPA